MTASIGAQWRTVLVDENGPDDGEGEWDDRDEKEGKGPGHKVEPAPHTTVDGHQQNSQDPELGFRFRFFQSVFRPTGCVSKNLTLRILTVKKILKTGLKLINN